MTFNQTDIGLLLFMIVILLMAIFAFLLVLPTLIRKRLLKKK